MIAEISGDEKFQDRKCPGKIFFSGVFPAIKSGSLSPKRVPPAQPSQTTTSCGILMSFRRGVSLRSGGGQHSATGSSGKGVGLGRTSHLFKGQIHEKEALIPRFFPFFRRRKREANSLNWGHDRFRDRTPVAEKGKNPTFWGETSLFLRWTPT